VAQKTWPTQDIERKKCSLPITSAHHLRKRQAAGFRVCLLTFLLHRQKNPSIGQGLGYCYERKI